LTLSEFKSTFSPTADRAHANSAFSQTRDAEEQHEGHLCGLSDYFLDGFGWRADDGRVGIVTVHYVCNPEFLELELSRSDSADTSSNLHNIRARMGLEELKLESCESVGNREKIKFHPPMRREYTNGLQVAFIAWVSENHISDRFSPWILHRISWKREQKAHLDRQDY
jgi:hypothetical protein